jgi:nitrite reductase/ring-hydroxylating ferredoxin subunit
MTAESPTRRTVLTTGAAAAGAAAGAVALAACAGGSTQSGSGSGGQSSAAGQPAAGGTAIASLSDVPVGGAKSVTIGGQAAIVARPSESNVVAFSAACTHKQCTVKIDAGKLKCPCHGSVFNALTGAVEHAPATAPLPSIPVKVDNGKIVSA